MKSILTILALATAMFLGACSSKEETMTTTHSTETARGYGK